MENFTLMCWGLCQLNKNKENMKIGYRKRKGRTRNIIVGFFSYFLEKYASPSRKFLLECSTVEGSI